MCDSLDVSRSLATPTPRPRWGRLYGIVALQLAVLTLADVIAPEVSRPIVDAVLVLTAFVTIALWVRTSQVVLDQQEWCACAARSVTVRVILSRHPEPRDARVARVGDGLVAEDNEDAWALASKA